MAKFLRAPSRCQACLMTALLQYAYDNPAVAVFNEYLPLYEKALAKHHKKPHLLSHHRPTRTRFFLFDYSQAKSI